MARVLKVKEHVPATWEEALELFLIWKRAQNLGKHTLDDYKRQVSQFYKRYPDAFECQPDRLKGQVYEYFADRMKPSTYNNRLVYLKVFFDWCVDKAKLMEQNPLQGFKKRKDEGRVVDLDEVTLKELINLPDKKTFTGIRDYALILLCLDTGIRPGEAFKLTVEDFNPKASQVCVRAENAKTRTQRTLNLSPPTVKAIGDLIIQHAKEWKNRAPIFCTYEGKALNRHTWGDRMEMYSEKLSVKIRPYDLRHSFALEFIRCGANALVVQKTLGHSDLTMTKRYVNLVQSDLKEQHLMYSPLNKLLPEKKRLIKI